MADGGKEEKRYIGGFAKSLKKYGSTCNHMKTQEKLIKHTVSKSDTLQGIALKYGVTMEQIRRINRLWASDSLFLRENLLIPSADQQQGEERELTTPELEAALLAAAQGSPLSPLEFRALPSGQDVSSPIMRECATAAALSPRDESRENDVSPPHEKSALQFLGEIDTSIAHTKNMVKKIQVSSNFREEEEGGGLLGVVGGVVPHHASGKRRPLHSRLHPNHHGTAGLQHHRAAAAKMAHHHHNHNNNNNHQHVAGGVGDKWCSSGGEALVGSGTGGGYQSGAGYQSGVGGYQGGGGADPLPPVVLTQGKKVRSSMQRLEQEADEMFEL